MVCHNRARLYDTAEPIDEVAAQCESSGAVHSGHFFPLSGNCRSGPELRGLRHIDESNCLYSPNHRTERHREPTNPSTLDETATVEHASKCLMPRT